MVEASRVSACALLAAGSFVYLSTPAQAEEEVRVASWGGVYQDALRAAIYEPAAEQTGVTIKDFTLKGIADVRLQVKSGAIQWDIVELFGGGCEQAKREGLTEPLDYTVINADGIDEDLVDEHWIGFTSYSTVLAWSKDVFPENPPQNWADFFNVEEFPGPRGLSPQSVTVEMALLADGVPPDELYPLDLDRAFRKLEELRPDVGAWWMTGAQATQLAMSGEVDMQSIWTARVEAAMEEGANVDYTYNQGLLNIECLIIPKGSPNKAAAMKVIAAMISPEIQANLPQYISYAPINTKAFDTGKIAPEVAARLNTSPENKAKQITVDVRWWAEHGQEVQERFDQLQQ